MTIAVCFFLTGACFGIYMLTRHLRRLPLPRTAAVLHGLAGATGFAFLLATVATTPSLVLAQVALIIMIGVVLLGCVNLLFHIRGLRHRTALILVHGGAAVSGVATLIVGIASAGAPTGDPTHKGGAPAPSASPAPEVARAADPQPQPTAAAVPVVAAVAPAPPPTGSMRPGPAWAEAPLTFELASAVLDARARASLAQVARDLERHAEVRLVEVQGHADEEGDATRNLDLTRARAAAVVAALVGQGVAPGRLRSAGFGSSCPADPLCRTERQPPSCHQPASWQRDRRVTLVVLEAGVERLQGNVACERGQGLAPQEDRRYAEQ